MTIHSRNAQKSSATVHNADAWVGDVAQMLKDIEALLNQVNDLNQRLMESKASWCRLAEVLEREAAD